MKYQPSGVNSPRPPCFFHHIRPYKSGSADRGWPRATHWASGARRTRAGGACRLVSHDVIVWAMVGHGPVGAVPCPARRMPRRVTTHLKLASILIKVIQLVRAAASDDPHDPHEMGGKGMGRWGCRGVGLGWVGFGMRSRMGSGRRIWGCACAGVVRQTRRVINSRLMIGASPKR